MNVYRLAICEDDGVEREGLRELCDAVLQERNIPHQLALFSSARELEDRLESEKDIFDILILDIMMDSGINGMELAHALRDRGDRISIIFISGYEEYLQEGYDVQPVHFLLKPVSPRKLGEALCIDWELRHKPKTLVLRKKNKMVSFSLEELCYVESSNHHIIVHCDGENKEFTMSLTEMERMLPAEQFCRCHHSFLVNMQCVREINRMYIYLQNGERLPIGRKYNKEFQKMFVRYMNL